MTSSLLLQSNEQTSSSSSTSDGSSTSSSSSSGWETDPVLLRRMSALKDAERYNDQDACVLVLLLLLSFALR